MTRRAARPLGQSFFAPDTLDVARALVGVTLVHGPCAGRIVEVEAYTDDAASHHVTRPKSARIMGETHGQVYVYSIYGMHWCLNFTTDARGPGAVLIRAVEPLEGLELMRQRRGVDRVEDLCSGPAKLVQAFGVEPSLHGRAVTDVFTLLPSHGEVDLVASPRIGIRRAADLPWRFSERGSRFVSRPRP